MVRVTSVAVISDIYNPCDVCDILGAVIHVGGQKIKPNQNQVAKISITLGCYYQICNHNLELAHTAQLFKRYKIKKF